jgi:hypothetical protein
MNEEELKRNPVRKSYSLKITNYLARISFNEKNRDMAKYQEGLTDTSYFLLQVLTEYAVQDLNVNPKLPFEDNSFDVITNVVNIHLHIF